MTINSKNPSIASAKFPQDAPDIARLCWDYRDLLISRTTEIPEIVEAYYAKDAYAALIEELPHIHARPKGDILVARLGTEVVGCAMYYPLNDTGLCEIKRVFVSPSGRGHGLGRRLMQAGMDAARRDGHSRMVLDTMVNLTEAITLYGKLGFSPAEPIYELDPRFTDYIRFFGIDLT